MKVVILHEVGGHAPGAVVDLDEASARWLADHEFADLVADDPEPISPEPSDPERQPRRRRQNARATVTDRNPGKVTQREPESRDGE